MSGSPIEQMIDKACGFDRKQFEEDRQKVVAEQAVEPPKNAPQLLLAVADAAKRWREHGGAIRYEAKLIKAIDAWIAIGG